MASCFRAGLSFSFRAAALIMSCNAFQGTRVRDTESDIDDADRKGSGFLSRL